MHFYLCLQQLLDNEIRVISKQQHQNNFYGKINSYFTVKHFAFIESSISINCYSMVLNFSHSYVHVFKLFPLTGCTYTVVLRHLLTTNFVSSIIIQVDIKVCYLMQSNSYSYKPGCHCARLVHEFHAYMNRDLQTLDF